jgi:hypothetical protein
MRVLALAGAVVAAAGGLLACNGVLGISHADLEPDAATSTGGDGGVDGAVAFVAEDDCMDYCNDVATACSTLPTQEYLSIDVCNQFCTFHTDHYDEQALKQAVDVSPMSSTAMGDTIYCRVWHAHAALGDPTEHCPHAGPLGGLLCGANPCDDFCNDAVHFCGSMAYASVQDCLQSCNADAGYPGLPYEMGDASDLAAAGNTLNCRIYHLQNYLATQDPDHCYHVRVPSVDMMGGAGPCVDTPDDDDY